MTCFSRSKKSPIQPRTKKVFRLKRQEGAHGFARAKASTMTSKTATDCFVYMTLPGQTEPVTAGRFELTKGRRGTTIGRFVYGKTYLARGDVVAIDPVELKLSGGTYQTAREIGFAIDE